MTAISVTATEAQVAITATNNRVTITEQPVQVEATTQNSTVIVNETTNQLIVHCLLYTSPSPRDRTRSRMPSSA